MSNVAHDVRGAMQAIAGYANLLDEEANGSLKPQQLQYIEYIKAGAKSAQEAIERCQARVDELVRSKSRP
jgi:light-regulated signal transduction histidine kinase (bacteriophytochrome)